MVYEKREDLQAAVAKETGFVQVRGQLIHELARGVTLGDSESDRVIKKVMAQTGNTRRPAHLTVDCCKRLLAGDPKPQAGDNKPGDDNAGGDGNDSGTGGEATNTGLGENAPKSGKTGGKKGGK